MYVHTIYMIDIDDVWIEYLYYIESNILNQSGCIQGLQKITTWHYEPLYGMWFQYLHIPNPSLTPRRLCFCRPCFVPVCLLIWLSFSNIIQKRTSGFWCNFRKGGKGCRDRLIGWYWWSWLTSWSRNLTFNVEMMSGTGWYLGSLSAFLFVNGFIGTRLTWGTIILELCQVISKPRRHQR